MASPVPPKVGPGSQVTGYQAAETPQAPAGETPNVAAEEASRVPAVQTVETGPLTRNNATGAPNTCPCNCEFCPREIKMLQGEVNELKKEFKDMAKEQPANLGKFMTTFMELIRLMIQQLNQQQQGNDAQAANNDTMNIPAEEVTTGGELPLEKRMEIE
ncbi:uncharacterized protein [Oryza sativa Japonica Group]|uniref:uncharacterized protein n=1 Tax=Oryza sativa subsp. japonica TaxID=39947 RepID=UPI000775565C|nr:uncharacterized protein LOC107279140 [Oryza sativa Japonica Group]